MDTQTLDKTLLACNFDIDLTIEKLQQLCLASSPTPPIQPPPQPQPPQQPPQDNVSDKDLKWVDQLVQEMTCATSIEDARARAARTLAARDRDQATTADNQKTIRLGQENCVLKRLVVLQHEKLKEVQQNYKQEVDKFNKMLSKYKEELKVLEFNNYSLRVRLSNSQPKFSLINASNFPPDVF
ncbi:hypothetical protein vseg_008283 [Gypsophila vaccaria]